LGFFILHWDLPYARSPKSKAIGELKTFPRRVVGTSPIGLSPIEHSLMAKVQGVYWRNSRRYIGKIPGGCIRESLIGEVPEPRGVPSPNLSVSVGLGLGRLGLGQCLLGSMLIFVISKKN
jgi:hypothetical protein